MRGQRRIKLLCRIGDVSSRKFETIKDDEMMIIIYVDPSMLIFYQFVHNHPSSMGGTTQTSSFTSLCDPLHVLFHIRLLPHDAAVHHLLHRRLRSRLSRRNDVVVRLRLRHLLLLLQR